MSDQFNNIVLKTVTDQESANALIGRLFDITKPDVVYGQPIVVGEHTIISASEYMARKGVGDGGGGGLGERGE